MSDVYCFPSQSLYPQSACYLMAASDGLPSIHPSIHPSISLYPSEEKKNQVSPDHPSVCLPPRIMCFSRSFSHRRPARPLDIGIRPLSASLTYACRYIPPVNPWVSKHGSQGSQFYARISTETRISGFPPRPRESRSHGSCLITLHVGAACRVCISGAEKLQDAKLLAPCFHGQSASLSESAPTASDSFLILPMFWPRYRVRHLPHTRSYMRPLKAPMRNTGREKCSDSAHKPARMSVGRTANRLGRLHYHHRTLFTSHFPNLWHSKAEHGCSLRSE